MKEWAEKNPKLAMAANVVLDIIAGGAKGTTTPKVKAMAESVAKNMKTAAKNSFGSMNPRM
jgi:ribosomal protein L17